MLRYIVKKEISEILTSPKFIVTFILCAMLILIAVYTGVANYRAELREYATSAALAEKGIADQPNYQYLAIHTIRISKPPQVLGTIVSGIDEAVGRVAPINANSEPALVDSKYDVNPVLAMFGTLDLMFIVKMVLSLFAILFTYDAIVGEKEKGTLKLALSNNIPRDRLLLGKAIGGFLCLSIPLLIPMIASLVVIMIVPDVSLSGNAWARLLGILVMFFAYLSVFFSLGLFVSARTSRSTSSFLILLFIWAIFVMIIPKTAVILAAQIKPIPSADEITAKKEAFFLQARVEKQNENQKWGQEHSAEYDKDPTAFREKMQKYLEASQREFTSKIDSYNAAVDLDYQVKKKAQQTLAVNLSRISPASALSYGTTTLACTGFAEYDRFLSSVREYKRTYAQWINSKLYQSNSTKIGNTPKIDLSGMPKLQLRPERLGDILARTLPDFALMAIMVVLLFCGAYISFRKYDVR